MPSGLCSLVRVTAIRAHRLAQPGLL